MWKKIGIVLISLLGIAALLWYYLDTTSFMNFLDTLSYYINQPLPIVGISVLTLCIFAWELYSHSAIGKKQLKQFKKEAEEVKEEFNEYKDKVEDWIENLQIEYEDKLVGVYSQFNLYESNIIGIIKEIPNKKVQDAVLKYEQEYETKKKEIENIIVDGYPAIEEKLKELDTIKSEFEEVIRKYEKELNDKTKD